MSDLEKGPNRYQKVVTRYNLTNVEKIQLSSWTWEETGSQFYDLHLLIERDSSKKRLITHIVKEDDAKRLKKAFEHLIELVKKDGDPFGN